MARTQAFGEGRARRQGKGCMRSCKPSTSMTVVMISCLSSPFGRQVGTQPKLSVVSNPYS